MADRFPLIVNAVSKKIEEIASGDRVDFTGNGIVISGDGGNGKYLTSNGSTVLWGTPGDVYLTQTQTVTNKTFESCVISASNNTLTNIPNSALVNSGITINGTTIALGGSVTTPDNNTTYSISVTDGLAATEKIIRLTSGGNAGAGVTDDVSLIAGTNVTLSRTGDAITINSSFVDTDTVTRLQSATGGALVSGDVTIAATGSSTVSQSGNTITINSTYVDTITRLRAGTGQVLQSGDFTLLSGGATTLSQSGTDITISSVNTVTRVKGGGAGTFQSGDITITGGGATTVTQSGNTVTVSSVDTNTVTRVRGTTSGTYQSGDITIVASGATSVSQSGNTIEISSVNTDTGALLTAGTGLTLTGGTEYSVKNSSNFTDNRVIKWDGGNQQFTNGIITDDGSTVTVGGDFVVTGTTTTINATTIQVADNNIELRKGNNLVGADGGITVNRTTNSSGTVLTYSSMEWYETGGYWRTYDGSISRRLVTETETQILTNKTLTSPILTSPTLGAASATTINGLTITSTASGVLTVANAKTLTASNTVRFTGTDGSVVDYRNGGSIAYTGDTLAVFATTTSTQLRGVITDSTGVGVLVFNTNPIFLTSVTTNSTSFNVFNSTATTVNAFGAATALTMGAVGGTTTLRGNLDVDEDVVFGTVVGDTFTVNGTPNFVNSDITIRGNSANPIKIGRGGNEIASNTRVGFDALQNNTTGSQNVALGFEAALTNNSGAANTALGYRALRSTGIGSENVAVGKDAMLSNLSGDNNVCVGNSSGGTMETANANVFIGHFAGYGATGTGNVIIGPADTEDSTSATYAPPSAGGSRQLVIGSGTETWIRGDQFFNLTVPNDLTVDGAVVIEGNLTVNGTTTTLNTSTLTVDDKTIELASVGSQQFSASITNNSVNITNITPTDGLIVGMQVTIITAGISVPAGTVIASIDYAARTAVLDQPVSGTTGGAVFNATGPFDTSADGAGIVVKGSTDKSITWNNTTDAWTTTEHFDIPLAKEYRVGNNLVAKNGQLGPSTGAWSLGAGVLSSSLTSVGTLTSLTVSGSINANGGINLGDNDVLNVGAGNDLQIYHNATHSFIENQTGNLYNRSNGEWIVQKFTSGENMIRAAADGAVSLYYDNALKFQTTSTGATVTGTLTVTDSLTLGVANTASAHINSFELMTFNIDTDNDDTNRYFAWFKDASSGAGTELLRLDENGGLTTTGTTNLKQITETVVNAFNTTLSPSSGTLTVDTSTGTVVLGDLNASVTTWAFTNVPTANSKATTVTLIIDGDTAQTYGDACSVNGSAVSGGVKWSGGSAPTATNNFDIITFTIVRDTAGIINVFGSGNTDFS